MIRMALKGHAWRILAVLLLSLSTGVGLAVTGPVKTASAHNPYKNDVTIYRGYMYEAFTSQRAVYVRKRALNSSATVTEYNLGGTTDHHVAMAAEGNGGWLSIFMRDTNDSIQSRTLLGAATSFQGWYANGGTVTDEPAASGGIGFTGVTVTGTDYVSRYFQYTGDGTNFTGYVFNQGKEIALGTNILTNSQNAQDGAYWAKPAVARIRMYLDCCGSETLRFDFTALNAYRDRGVRTMIFNSSEAITDTGRFQRQITNNIGGGSLLDWAKQNPNVNVFFELGNEPDQVYKASGNNAYYDAYQARYRALDILDYFNNNYRNTNQNFRLMISLPTTADGTNYFTAFTSDTGDGRGRVGDRFDAMGIHTYSFSCISRLNDDGTATANPEGAGTPLAQIDRAKGAGNSPIYVTEAAINGASAGYPRSTQAQIYAMWDEFGKRYVNALNSLDESDGRIKGVTYFQDDQGSGYGPQTGTPYNIDMGAGDFIAHKHMGNKDRSAACINK